jgi:hypothetical protein
LTANMLLAEERRMPNRSWKTRRLW